MKDSVLNKKLKLATDLAKRHKDLLRVIKNELERRSGGDYNNLDCDGLIDALEGGQSYVTTAEALSEIRENMLRKGLIPKERSLNANT